MLKLVEGLCSHKLEQHYFPARWELSKAAFKFGKSKEKMVSRSLARPCRVVVDQASKVIVNLEPTWQRQLTGFSPLSS